MRRRHALFAALAVALPLLVAAPATAEDSDPAPVEQALASRVVESQQSRSWVADGLYYVSYTGELWQVDSKNRRASAISYAQWQQLGFPGYKPAPTDYVRYAWSNTLYAVTFFGPDRAQWLWAHMSFEEWSRAGRPAARSAGWIEGTHFYQWRTSPNVYVIDDGGTVHSLTWGEYVAAGQPAFARHEGGYYRLPWDSTGAVIFLPIWGDGDIPPQALSHAAGMGRPIYFHEWQALGQPAPQVVAHLPQETGNGGVVGSPGRLSYMSRAYMKNLTDAEYAAMGRPAPQAECSGLTPCYQGSGPDAFPHPGQPPYYVNWDRSPH